MKIEISTISTKKFLLITLASVPLAVSLSLGLALLTSFQGLVFLVFPLMVLIMYLGRRFSTQETTIDLSGTEVLRINNFEIPYKSITGYFIDAAFAQTALCVRLETERTIQITSSSFGAQGKKFREAREEIIMRIKSLNQNVHELEYQDVYVRQINILRPLFYILSAVILFVNVIAIYFTVYKKIDLPWQIFLVNFSLFGLIPYMKKRNISDPKRNR